MSRPYTARFALADNEFTGPVLGAYETWADAEDAVRERADARVIVIAYESHGRVPLTWQENPSTGMWESGHYGVYPATRQFGGREVTHWIAYLRTGSQATYLASTDSRARALAACESYAFDHAEGLEGTPSTSAGPVTVNTHDGGRNV